LLATAFPTFFCAWPFSIQGSPQFPDLAVVVVAVLQVIPLSILSSPTVLLQVSKVL
jgi:hypothetical protein